MIHHNYNLYYHEYREEIFIRSGSGCFSSCPGQALPFQSKTPLSDRIGGNQGAGARERKRTGGTQTAAIVTVQEEF